VRVDTTKASDIVKTIRSITTMPDIQSIHRSVSNQSISNEMNAVIVQSTICKIQLLQSAIARSASLKCTDSIQTEVIVVVAVSAAFETRKKRNLQAQHLLPVC
jgi:hypothetical protein